MKKKLFITCPFSCLEVFLQKKFGENNFFHSSLAGVMKDQKSETIAALKDFVLREQIDTIYLVNDTQCRFIDNIINKKKLWGLDAEFVLEEIYIEYYLTEFEKIPQHNRAFKLAHLNVMEQMEELRGMLYCAEDDFEKQVQIKGLITNKSKGLFKEINFTNSYQDAY